MLPYILATECSRRPTTLIVGAFDDEPSIASDGAEATNGRTARRIASTIGRMISTGSLEVGTRLPTVRELSRRLGVSPTTVSEAWRRLADVGAIETRGRNGTFVRHPTGPGGPRRYRQISEGPGHFALDLSSGTPDPDLLPDLAPIVAKVSRQSLTSSYLDHPVLPALEDELRATWPFAPEAITVVDGALDALDRVASVVLRLGDRVVVEHPGFPPMLDLLERLACDVIGVDVDDEGLDVAQLRDVVDTGPAGRRDPPTACAEPRRRGDVVAAGQGDRRRRCGPIAALVVEDDHANEISSAPLTSIGTWLPERTVHIRSFSKSHGPDLRLAAVGGCRRRGHRGREPPAARARLVEPDPAVRAARVDPSSGRRARRCERGARDLRRAAPGASRACSSTAVSTSPAPTASTCGWGSTTSEPPSSPSPPKASASHPAHRSSCVPTPTTSASRSAPCRRRASSTSVAEQLAAAASWPPPADAATASRPPLNHRWVFRGRNGPRDTHRSG